MNDVSTIALPSIEWPKPIINDRERALEDAGCYLERALSLLGATVIYVLDEVIPDALGHPQLSKSVHTSYMHLRIVEEKLEELDRLVGEIIEAAPAAVTPVGRHVELRQRSDWAEAVAAYKAAEAVPIDETTGDDVFDAAGEAFRRMLNTRAPTLRCLHEKMMLIDSGELWTAHGATLALFDDVEALVRKHEIAAGSTSPCHTDADAADGAVVVEG